MKTIWILVSVAFLFSACKKELVEELEPQNLIYQQPLWASFVSNITTELHNNYVYPQHHYSAYYTKAGNLVEGGVVTANGTLMSFNDYFYQVNTYSPFLQDTVIWTVSSTADFPAFTYASVVQSPQMGLFRCHAVAHVDRNYTLEATFVAHADSTCFVVGNKRFVTAGSVKQHTFTIEELKDLPIGNSMASMTAFTYEKVQIGGVWMEFRKEETQQRFIRIWR